MRRLAIACLLALPAVAVAQAPGRSIHRDKVAGAEVEFVDHPWRPDVFAAFESGAGAPEGSRAWAFARLTTSWYLSIGGTVLWPGRYVLVLTPKTGELPMSLELRRGDGREIFADLTAMATPAGGETVYKSPASFAAGSDPVPALDITLAGWSDGVVLTVRYGNRKLTRELARAGP
jgi:hypothetical protein